MAVPGRQSRMPEVALELPSNGRFGDALNYASLLGRVLCRHPGVSGVAVPFVRRSPSLWGRTTQHRRWWILGLAVLAVVLVVGAGGWWLLWRHFHQGQRMSIPGTVGSPSAPTPAPSTQATPEGPPFVTSVSPSGRYFLDQYGRPLLLHGDSPWALMTLLSPQQARLWFADRQTQGFNAAIISLIGAKANGAPSDDGATFDGLLPFVDGDILQWQEPYWERVTTYLRMAAEHGITVMLYPIDAWTIGHSFVPKSIEQCHQYGGKVAQRFRDLPNIMWMSGGDYTSASEDPARGSDVDHCIDAMMRGIREAGTGDPSPCSSIHRRSPPRTPSGHSGSTGTSSTPTTRPIRPCWMPTAGAGETGGSRRGQLRGREQPAADTTDHGRDPSPAGALGDDLRGGRRVRRQ